MWWKRRFNHRRSTHKRASACRCHNRTCVCTSASCRDCTGGSQLLLSVGKINRNVESQRDAGVSILNMSFLKKPFQSVYIQNCANPGTCFQTRKYLEQAPLWQSMVGMTLVALLLKREEISSSRHCEPVEVEKGHLSAASLAGRERLRPLSSSS